jgi:transcriptional regulator with XRE-family HTH domain
MLASPSGPEGGERLRAVRELLCLSLREVENLSRGIAAQKEDADYYVAHASLADIENGKLTPTIYKLYTLSVIYGRRYDEMAALAGVPIGDVDADRKALSLPNTYLIGSAPANEERVILTPTELREKLRSEPTNLVPKMFETWKDIPDFLLQQMDWRKSLYGYVGMEDYTLHPFIRPGSFVQIDSRQRKIPPMNWHSEFDRPIFFVELRDRYLCIWCELHGNQLILIPAQQSHRPALILRHPEEVTIVGRVTAVTMRIAEGGESALKGPSPR